MTTLPRPRYRFYDGKELLMIADAHITYPPVKGQLWELIDAANGHRMPYEVEEISIRQPARKIANPATGAPAWEALAGWDVIVQLIPVSY